jgi:hypothetical protein
MTIEDVVVVGCNAALPSICNVLCPMNTPKRSRRSSSQTGASPTLLALLIGFAFGCVISATFLLTLKLDGPKSAPWALHNAPSNDAHLPLEPNSLNQQQNIIQEPIVEQPSKASSSSGSILSGVRILIAIAAFDFSQLPHLEEVLDAYSDLCATGAQVDLIVHATVPYPITLIDLLNTRLTCLNPAGRFDVKISLVSPTVRLHLVDIHRPLFYEKIEEYDLFIYTEDDIRVTPRTIAAYLHETKVLQDKIGFEKSLNYNVGIVRYEYNFPSNVLMDDNTRHATQNVTRVYWEHSYHTPAFPKVVDVVPDLNQEYVHMKNHHQGMFLATRDLLKAWKKRCQFDVVTNRPGGASQPKEGTQVRNTLLTHQTFVATGRGLGMFGSMFVFIY